MLCRYILHVVQGMYADPTIPMDVGMLASRMARVGAACGVHLGTKELRSSMVTNQVVADRLSNTPTDMQRLNDQGHWNPGSTTAMTTYHAPENGIVLYGHQVRSQPPGVRPCAVYEGRTCST